MTRERRYAVYFQPETGHPLLQAGTTWLAGEGSAWRAAGLSVPDQRVLADHLEGPRRYGFHATIKAPMRLAPGTDAAAWQLAATRLAEGLEPVLLPALQVQELDDFVALVPVVADPRLPALAQIADRVVASLDTLRAPLAAHEVARREPARLAPMQRQMLARWGYPHVFSQWRFHLTLCGPLRDPGMQAVRIRIAQAAARHFGPALREPLAMVEICLFVEPSPGARFELLARCPLGAGQLRSQPNTPVT